MKNKELIGKELNFTQHYKEMWPFVKPYWIRALLAILICIPVGALDSVVALALKPYMDNVLVDKSASSPAYIPVLIVAFTTVQGFLNYAATYLNTWVGTKINHDLKRALFKKLMSFEPAFYDKNASGYVIQRFTTDADTACTGLLDNLKLFVSRFFSSVSLIAVLIYNSWQLAIIAVIVLLCALLPLSQVRRRIKGIIKNTIEESSTILTHYNESYAGNKTIASYNLQEKMYRQFNEILRSLFKLTMKMVQKTGWMTPMMHIVVSIGVGGVIGYGSYLIVNGSITSGNFVSFITALIMLYTPIKGIGKNFNNVQVSFLAIERIVEILDTEPTIVNKADAKTLKGVKKEIAFNGVEFGYLPDVKVLNGINLKIKAGSTVAFVGNSGGGKTTIVNLLPRFYDVCKGKVTIDGIDVRDYTLDSLRNNIAVVFQDNFLFSGTIRENILLGKPDATEQEIRKALQMAYLEDFVNEQEKGLDTDIGERGSALSGGQRQRLAIARAMIKNAPIVILDEATSALDNKSEAVVQKAIDNLMQDRTVFIIAHRLSTIQNADTIVVLNNGKIVETGNHDTLINKQNGAYQALYNAQFKTK
uniref:Lipid A export permease/ATP-binding protein MsbA n=1 Tax=uncultured Alphaproteobacteria bacterium TaxID=91750 RepID=A0A6G8F351_9PROT|nr:lipid A export permease/ATP-binding protein MsbA [uncultured Alphaproteobacteria bacterium]